MRNMTTLLCLWLLASTSLADVKPVQTEGATLHQIFAKHW
ncbi:MAG: hypothetical protein ACJAX5_003620 [Patiriisocius sp.]|jgi:hypothetical protein